METRFTVTLKRFHCYEDAFAFIVALREYNDAPFNCCVHGESDDTICPKIFYMPKIIQNCPNMLKIFKKCPNDFENFSTNFENIPKNF
jgi:hypothetical protein